MEKIIKFSSGMLEKTQNKWREIGYSWIESSKLSKYMNWELS